MKFLSVKETADKWHVSHRRVLRLADEGRIPGAVLRSLGWMIPADAEKPADGRANPGKTESGKSLYRFPFYMNGPEESFVPPLSQEERKLRQAQIDFLACNFETAKTSLEHLKDETQNGDIRIAALYFLCYLSAGHDCGEGFEEYDRLLETALSEPHTHQQELGLLRPYLLGCLALFENAMKNFRFDIEYAYSPAAYSLLYFLFFLTGVGCGTAGNVDTLLEISEVNAKRLENDGIIYGAQMMHVLLLGTYYFKANEKAAIYHLKKGLDIAYEHRFLYPMADIYVYYADLYSKVLKDYPDEFANQISDFGNRIHQSYAAFMSRNKITDLYTELSKSEYPYVFYACEGHSNLNVAKILHVSERTVANRYAEIYDKLEVKGKQELVEKMKAIVSGEIGGENADPHGPSFKTPPQSPQ